MGIATVAGTAEADEPTGAPHMEAISPAGVSTGNVWNVLDGTVNFVFDFHDNENDLTMTTTTPSEPNVLEFDIFYSPTSSPISPTSTEPTLQGNFKPYEPDPLFDSDKSKYTAMGITPTYDATNEKWTITVDTDALISGNPAWPAGRYDFYIVVEDGNHNKWGDNINYDKNYAHYTYYFHSIQTAINAASDGDTVNVAAGTYNENVVLPASKSLTLLGAQHDVNPGCNGERGAESILNGVSYTSGKYGIAFPTNPGTIVINGFTIKNYAYGIWGRETGTHVDGATISYNILENNGDPTLPGGGSDDNNWHDDGGALRVKNMDNSIITYNLVRNGERGIRLENDSTETSDSNTVSYNCAHDNQQYGIAIYDGGNNNVVEHNIVYNNADRGIQLTYTTSTGNKINYNTVYNNCNDGILLQGGSNAEIKGNIVYNNAFTNQTRSGTYTDNGGPNSGFGYQPVHGGITVNYGSADRNNIIISGNNVHDNGVLPAGQWPAWTGIRSNASADGIYIGAGTTVAAVNFNNIENNPGYGVENLNTNNTLDATNNWWGDPSGPSGNGHGTGDTISDKVNYDPWLDAPYPEGKPIRFTSVVEGTVTNGTFDATEEANTEVVVTGSAITTVAKYSDNPGTGFTGDIGKYIDVYFTPDSVATEIEIRLYYTDAEVAGKDESSLKLYWWDGSKWSPCSDTGVNTASNYIWANITSTSTPALTDLGVGGIPATPFAAGGNALVTSSGGGGGGGYYPQTTTTTTTEPEGEVKGITTEKDSQTIEELQQIVNQIIKQLQSLLLRLVQSGKTIPPGAEKYLAGISQIQSTKLSDITRDLQQGLQGEDVKLLQSFLINQDTGPKARVLKTYGPTGYFGSATRDALAEYQASVGIKPSLGYFGPITRSYLKSIGY
ncbi:MAG: right-handed parallel beta-helix repeat-containing protein [Candidatus Pacebacteria bacterium]|nr:right-handed parallel beta-helix repeat-containing protein [Candidatus Paceibacterota bacterium]